MAEIERTKAGWQMIIPGCERRTLPKSATFANWHGQGLLGFYKEPSHRELLARRTEARLTPKRGQKPPQGLFQTCR
jgi:hypothetical protein